MRDLYRGFGLFSLPAKRSIIQFNIRNNQNIEQDQYSDLNKSH